MADRAISALTSASVLTNSDLFVLSQSNQAKSATWQLIISYLSTALAGHGGISTIALTSSSGLTDTYTITFADATTSTFTLTNGKGVSSTVQYWAVSSSDSVQPSTWYTTMQTMDAVNRYLWGYEEVTYNDSTTSSTTPCVIGVYGDTGQAWYVHIKYAGSQPTQDADMGNIPDAWIGIYSGTSSTAPTTYTSYDWYEMKGATGATGSAASISSQAVTYQEGTSGTVAPSGTWTSSIPTVTQGNYLWTKTVLDFNDGTTVTSYSVARMGVDGTGSVVSVNSISPDGNGNVALTATDIPASDNDSVETHIANIESDVTTLQTNAANKVLYFTGVTCSAMTGDFVTYNDAAITTDYVLAECVFADPTYITTDVTWTTITGYLKLNGTCSTATTCNVVLIKKDN